MNPKRANRPHSIATMIILERTEIGTMVSMAEIYKSGLDTGFTLGPESSAFAQEKQGALCLVLFGAEAICNPLFGL